MYDGATFSSVRANQPASPIATAPVEFTPASPAEIQALVYQAQQMRAAAVGAMIADLIAGPVLRFRAWSENRATVQELQALDDTMLRDIGIERGQIDGIAVAASAGKVSANGAAVPVGLALGWLDLPTPANSNSERPRNFAIVDAAD